jgi:biotin carboxylase
VKRVLIVGCGFPQLSLVRTAKRMGLHVLGADRDPRAVAAKYCDEFFEVSTGDADGLLDVIRAARANAVTTTGSEVSLKATATVAARAGLPFYADPETVRLCQDKDAMRAGYVAAGLAVPAFARCETVEQAVAFAERRALPLVVKPSRGWGQRGVARVESLEQLAQAFGEARSHSATAGLPSVVVEEWLEGREVSVNGWIEDGRLVSYCVTERITVPGNKPLGVMIAEVYPSGLSPDDEARVVEEARRGAAALGHTRGPCYSQVAIGARGCFLFETAARLGGGFDADVTRLASGVDLYERLLGIALGDATLERQGRVASPHGGAVAKFLVGTPGGVVAVKGLDDARALPGIDDAEVFVPVGGRVFPLTDSAKRAAYVLAHGPSRAAAVAQADAALARIRIDTRPDGPPSPALKTEPPAGALR